MIFTVNEREYDIPIYFDRASMRFSLKEDDGFSEVTENNYITLYAPSRPTLSDGMLSMGSVTINIFDDIDDAKSFLEGLDVISLDLPTRFYTAQTVIEDGTRMAILVEDRSESFGCVRILEGYLSDLTEKYTEKNSNKLIP